jgi:hypothetical protein
METSLNISNVERVDEVPVLLAQMQKMGTASLLDKFFPTHQNWKGLSLGGVTSAWVAHILSEGVLHVIFDDSFLPATGDVAEVSVKQVVRAHDRKAIG